MPRPVIITCAVTGGGDTVGKHPAIPVTPAEIARASIEAGEAGAAIAHIHVRDPETGRASSDLSLYREVVARIRDSGSDIVINLTTGEGGVLLSDESPAGLANMPLPGLLRPARRVAHVEALRPEICTLDMGSLNLGNFLFINTPRDIAEIAEGIAGAGVIPELEVFDTGHLRLALSMVEGGQIRRPVIYQIVLGVPWGAPATTEAMLMMRNMLPKDAVWAAFGVGVAEFPMLAQAVLLGGHVRVGLEDNFYLEKGVIAPDNASLVRKAVQILAALGGAAATPAQARAILRQSSRQ